MRADMNAIRCISDDREELFSLQMKAGNLYARYENANVDVSRLELRPDANHGQIAKREGEREDLWSQRESSTNRSARLLIRSRLRTSPNSDREKSSHDQRHRWSSIPRAVHADCTDARKRRSRIHRAEV